MEELDARASPPGDLAIHVAETIFHVDAHLPPLTFVVGVQGVTRFFTTNVFISPLR